MAALVAAIHVLKATSKKDVDAGHKAGHDEYLHPGGANRSSTLSHLSKPTTFL